MKKSALVINLTVAQVICLLSVIAFAIPTVRAEQVSKILDNTGATRFHWLIVGQNHKNLRGAEGDARGIDGIIEDWWKKHPPAAGSHENLLLNCNATKANIEAWFAAEKVGGHVQPGDEVIFYYAGHGGDGPDNAGTPDTNHDEPDGYDNNIWPSHTCNETITDDELTTLLSGFPRSVTFVVILDSCESHTFTDGSTDLPHVTDDAGKRLASGHLEALMASSPNEPKVPDDPSYTQTGLLPGLRDGNTDGFPDADANKDGITTAKELFNYSNGLWKARFYGDNDYDLSIDEDDVDHAVVGGKPTHLYIDNDGDWLVDEDPRPKEATYFEITAVVGGVWVPVDKFGLLAPYIGLTSTIIVATVATAIYVKRVKRRKEKP